jgi:flavin-dependent dehydrogenase
VLESLGLWTAFVAAGFPESAGTRAAWGAGAPYDNEFLYGAHGPGWRLDRNRFDALLLHRAREAGVTIADAPVEADFVVDATGRSATVAVSHGAKRLADDQLVGIGCMFATDAGSAPRSYTLVEACEDGWWYAACLPDGRTVAAFLTDADLARQARLHDPGRWREHLDRTGGLVRDRIGNAGPVAAPAIFSARSQCLDTCAGPGWLAAGDAAASFDPLSSQGILRALRLGKIAAFTVFDTLRGRREAIGKYRSYVSREYDHYRATKSKVYTMESRWPDAPFWARRRKGAIAIPEESTHGQHDTQPLPAF